MIQAGSKKKPKRFLQIERTMKKGFSFCTIFQCIVSMHQLNIQLARKSIKVIIEITVRHEDFCWSLEDFIGLLSLKFSADPSHGDFSFKSWINIEEKLNESFVMLRENCENERKRESNLKKLEWNFIEARRSMENPKINLNNLQENLEVTWNEKKLEKILKTTKEKLQVNSNLHYASSGKIFDRKIRWSYKISEQGGWKTAPTHRQPLDGFWLHLNG